MKRFVLAALILGSMTACTKSNIQYEPSGEISLQPVTERATKAALSGTEYSASAPAFNVWAWWTDKPSGTQLADFLAAEDLQEYIKNGEFVHRGNGSWGGATPYYWPTKGSLVFSGYSPSETIGGTFDYDVLTDSFKADGYIQSVDISQTVDLMWFDLTERSYDANDNKNSLGETVNGVPVVFHHALSWLKFGFKLKSGVPQNWRITSVTLTGIADRADLNSTSDPAWTGHSGDKNVPIWSGTHVVTETIHYPESVTDGVVVIPQACADDEASLVITYDLKKHLDGESEEWLRAQTVTLKLAAGTDGNAWKPGKKYIYTIVFGENEIHIAPTVTEWADGGDVEIEVQ